MNKSMFLVMIMSTFLAANSFASILECTFGNQGVQSIDQKTATISAMGAGIDFIHPVSKTSYFASAFRHSSGDYIVSMTGTKSDGTEVTANMSGIKIKQRLDLINSHLNGQDDTVSCRVLNQ